MRFLPLLPVMIMSLQLISHPASATPLASFRVYYTFLPSRVDQASTSVPIDSALAYEARGSECLGYTVDSRMGNRYADDQQGQRMMDLQASSYEAADGTGFELSQTQFTNKEPGEPERITVSRPLGSQSPNGQIKGAKSSRFTLIPEILFPTAHEIKLLAAAAKGETRDQSYVYDGSDGEKFFRAITFIGKKREAGSAITGLDKSQAKDLQNFASWPFSIGYYPGEDAKADTPSFQASFNMYENGVTTELTFDYGSYAMKGTLQKLEILPDEPCDAKRTTPEEPKPVPQ
jgi:hypothetical protein